VVWCGVQSLEVTTGDAKARQITCGGGKHLTLSALSGKSVPVVLNIKKTEGMIFVAQSADGKHVELVEAPANAAVGDRVTEQGTAAQAGMCVWAVCTRVWCALSARACGVCVSRVHASEGRPQERALGDGYDRRRLSARVWR